MIGLGSGKDGKVVMGIMALIGNGKIASNPPNPDDLVVVRECSVSLYKRICLHFFSYYSSFIYLLTLTIIKDTRNIWDDSFAVFRAIHR